MSLHSCLTCPRLLLSFLFASPATPTLSTRFSRILMMTMNGSKLTFKWERTINLGSIFWHIKFYVKHKSKEGWIQLPKGWIQLPKGWIQLPNKTLLVVAIHPCHFFAVGGFWVIINDDRLMCAHVHWAQSLFLRLYFALTFFWLLTHNPNH